jgi:hypothetical protein
MLREKLNRSQLDDNAFAIAELSSVSSGTLKMLLIVPSRPMTIVAGRVWI